ncbi:MAG TPA: hypothetical protein EYN07_05095 [Flavobacteriaceae bacterium]|jgi:glycosyltransferase involved in cell wall biosynthesis|nr:hypothetical protein [Flavobacteriaceae bacterium]MAY53311.1 hypothetical protein [Flavobacteriaceae bacterium]HIB46735.1 hypothetical protein [Flavobacteriaceae bacterium]HIN98599.1 hypothetical protein [Flavobacteriaceae bacterium]|tara:strand:+ start:111974 stop:113296 length:1323 start_codon:yes stop_codon:yes gene_type:complete
MDNFSQQNKKNILIVSYGYPPFNAPSVQRPYTLAKYLDKSKYKVTVITCPNADSSLGYDPNFDEALADVLLIKIDAKFLNKISGFRTPEVSVKKRKSTILTKIKQKIFSLGASIIFPDKGVFWYGQVVRYLKEHSSIIDNCDIVFTSSPLATNHNLGNYIKKKRPDVRWVAEFEDYHYLENWSQKRGVLSSLHKKLEMKVIKNSDKVTFVSETMKNNYKKYYHEYAKKFYTIYNGYDTDNYKYLNFDTLENEKLSITYAGSFYKGVRSPIPLLKLLDRAIKKGVLKKDEVVVKIAGNFEPILLEEAKNYESFSCIDFLGKIPRSQVLRLFANSHLLWLIVGNQVTHYTSVPLKLFEYLASRRPILNFAPYNSEASAIIEKFNLGVNFDVQTEEFQSLEQKFYDLVGRFHKNELAEPLPAQEIDIFSRKTHALQFEAVFES